MRAHKTVAFKLSPLFDLWNVHRKHLYLICISDCHSSEGFGFFFLTRADESVLFTGSNDSPFLRGSFSCAVLPYLCFSADLPVSISATFPGLFVVSTSRPMRLPKLPAVLLSSEEDVGRGPNLRSTRFNATANEAMKYNPPPQASPTAALIHIAPAVVIPWTRWWRSPVIGSTSEDFTMRPAPRKPTPEGIAADTRDASHP